MAPQHQFDQGGLILWRDENTWLKTGIEVVDNQPKLSCVVTRDGYSDWSTQDWTGLAMTIRLSQTGNGAYVVQVRIFTHGKSSRSMQSITTNTHTGIVWIY